MIDRCISLPPVAEIEPIRENRRRRIAGSHIDKLDVVVARLKSLMRIHTENENSACTRGDLERRRLADRVEAIVPGPGQGGGRGEKDGPEVKYRLLRSTLRAEEKNPYSDPPCAHPLP
jgi:hypothetical protein